MTDNETAAQKPQENDVLKKRLAAFEQAAKAHGLSDAERDLPEEPDEPEEESSEDLEPDEEKVGGETKKEEVSDEAYRRAAAALLRSGFDQAEIEAMGPARVVERGSKRHEILARDDFAYQRLRELEKPHKETPSESSEPATPEPAGVPELDFKKAVTPFADAYGLDDEAAEALAKTFEEVVGPLAKEIASFKEIRSNEERSAIEKIVTEAREEVGSSYPDLKDEDTFTRVVQRMVLLQQDPTYASLKGPQERTLALMEDAARSLKLEAKEPSTGRRTVRRSTPDTPTARRAEAPANLTPAERKWRVFKHLQSHPGDVEGAQRLFGTG